MDYDFSKTKEYIKQHKFLLNLLKTIVVVASLYFLIKVSIQNFQKIKEISLFNKQLVLWFLLVSVILYTLLLTVLAKSWKTILETIDGRNINYWILIIYLKSLIYKYLPGNVFHYASRQIAANQRGIKHSTLLQSNIYEAFFLILAAAFFSLFFLDQWELWQNYFVGYLLIIMGFIILIIIYSYRKTKIIKIFLNSMPYYMLYFIGIGTLCFYVVNFITHNNLPFMQCIALYSIAWIAGFVIPGAPGGIGVRESMFIMLSNNLISQPEAIFVITLLRVSTTLGELFAYIIAQIIYFYHQNDTSNL